MTRYELYKAVKNEVRESGEETGLSLTDVWSIVNGKLPKGKVFNYGIKELQKFWYTECLNDYFK